MNQPTKWENYLHLMEFSYNNGYHSSFKVSPFEVMYGRICNTPISWDNSTNKVIIGTKLLKKMEDQIVRIKHNLKTTHDRQKSYAYQNRIDRQFQAWDHVF